ncbi:MAG TPA: FAD-dependent oxidoreductase, partial [Propionibacteriaceae bacterium]|nr:FAD-dependent oxidoreductase [Propionibacteriaceae bacterium]
MTIEHIETAIIGAGQAGLATAYHLQRAGRPCLILDGNEHVGDNWRAQWDSLRLYTPAQYDGLPGLPFPSPRWSYPSKDQVAD